MNYKCFGCTWKKVDACDLKQYNKDTCPMEQEVKHIIQDLLEKDLVVQVIGSPVRYKRGT